MAGVTPDPLMTSDVISLASLASLASEDWHRSAEEQQGKLEATMAEAARYLPNQAILENFVHQNPFEEFEDMPFGDALKQAHVVSKAEGPGARCLAATGYDPRPRVNAVLADLSATFLDRGSARWQVPRRELGFLHFFASMEGLDFGLGPRWRSGSQRTARQILEDFKPVEYPLRTRDHRQIAARHLLQSWQRMGVSDDEWQEACHEAMAQLPGWAGMFHHMEHHPAAVPRSEEHLKTPVQAQGIPMQAPEATIRLLDYATVHAVLLASSLEAVEAQFGRGTNVMAWLQNTAAPG